MFFWSSPRAWSLYVTSAEINIFCSENTTNPLLIFNLLDSVVHESYISYLLYIISLLPDAPHRKIFSFSYIVSVEPDWASISRKSSTFDQCLLLSRRISKTGWLSCNNSRTCLYNLTRVRRWVAKLLWSFFIDHTTNDNYNPELSVANTASTNERVWAYSGTVIPSSPIARLLCTACFRTIHIFIRKYKRCRYHLLRQPICISMRRSIRMASGQCWWYYSHRWYFSVKNVVSESRSSVPNANFLL